MVKKECKVCCINQQKLVLEIENKLIKKKLQELQMMRNKYNNNMNSRKYRFLNKLSGKYLSDETRLGVNGENLTVIIHFNEKTFIFLESFFKNEPYFSGKIVLLMNKTQDKLENDIKNYFCHRNVKYKFLFFDGNKDVYSELNQAVEVAETDWVSYLDSDYMITNPFIQSLELSLKETGCYFLNFPVRDVKTDWIIENQLMIRKVDSDTGRLIVNPELGRLTKTIDEFSNILNSHAFVMKKDSFLQVGRFHAEYKKLQGLELANRIGEKCLAIGNCKSVFLCGEVPASFGDLTANSENKLFKETYGVGICDSIEELDTYTKMENRLRVALIVDEENWSFHNIAVQVQSCLEDDMDVEIFFYSYTPNAIQLILTLRDYDIIHFMWRSCLYILSEQESNMYLSQIGMSYNEFKAEYLDKICITTSVYDHLFVEKEDEKQMTECLLEVCDEYTVSSELLFNIYKEKFHKHPLKKVTDGVDLNKFYPQHLERFKERNCKKLVIGWVGNSQFFGMKDKDLKGVNTILKPAIEELQEEGVDVERYFADRQERMISHDQMCDYYSKIDVLVCTSLFEGTPNPVLEAMACGVPVISTNVGIVPEALGEFQKHFILKERSIECLKKTIMTVIDHPEYLMQCSNENLEYIKKWDWKRKTRDFKEFFEETYKKHGKDKL